MKGGGERVCAQQASSLNVHVQQHLFTNCLRSNSKSVSKSNMGVLQLSYTTIGSYIVTGRRIQKI